MAQSGGGDYRRKENTEQVSHPKLGRVHRRDLTPAQFTFQDTPEAKDLILLAVGCFAAVQRDADRPRQRAPTKEAMLGWNWQVTPPLAGRFPTASHPPTAAAPGAARGLRQPLHRLRPPATTAGRRLLA